MNAIYANPHPESCPWHAAAEIVGAPNIKWCEETLCQWISEPANTWSNMLYIAFGLLIIYQTRNRSEYEMKWMGPGMFLMGLLSLIYHASNNYLTQIGDFIGMYLFVFWLMVINFRRVGWIKRRAQIPVFVAASAACTILIHVLYVAGIKFQLIVAASVALILVTEFLAHKRNPDTGSNYIRYFVALAFVAAAQTFSLLDGSRIWCEPTNHIILQGHALWHILAAIGLYIAFLHYKDMVYSDD